MCCVRLAGNTGRKNDPKSRHLSTIAQHCRAEFSQLRHVSTIGKKLVKQQYFLHMSAQYGELRPTSGWDRFVSLGHPIKFQRLSRLGIITARHSSTGHQPNFAALNRGRHLYSAGRPSRWALAQKSLCTLLGYQYAPVEPTTLLSQVQHPACCGTVPARTIHLANKLPQL